MIKPLERVSRYRHGHVAFAVACGYALLVLGVTGFVVWAKAADEASFAGLWLMVVTLPSAPLAMLVSAALPAPDSGGWRTLIRSMPFAAAGLFQAWIMWRAGRGAQAPGTADDTPL